jgi:hypothetical protein
MMKPSVSKWQDLAEPYRSEAWPDCARLVRAHVDQNPYDFAMRALLASLLVRTRQRTMAIMQYEQLLPLAVGQGHFFRAIATQRRLDDLLPANDRHPDRYLAIQDWFRAFVRARPERARREGGVPAPDALAAGALLDLPPDTFTAFAEQSSVVPLGMAPQALNEPAGLLWVVYFGRIRWRVDRGDDATGEERVSEAGDLILMPPGSPSERWLSLTAETPAEVLKFDPELASLLDRPEGEARTGT